MKRFISPLGLVLLASMTGCASMEVKVNILDKSVTQSPAWVRCDVDARAPYIRGLLVKDNDGNDVLDKQIERVKESIAAVGKFRQFKNLPLPNYGGELSNAKNAYQNGVTELDNALNPDLSQAERDKCYLNADADWKEGDYLAKKVRREFAEDTKVGTVLYDVIHAHFNTDAALAPTSRAFAPTTATSELTLGVIAATTAATTAPTTIATASTAPAMSTNAPATADSDAKPKPETIAAAAALPPRMATAVDSLIGNAGILNDPHASLVVGADESYWHGVFNKAFGCGGLGNTDIAVKMQSLGDFTLKGVRTDNSKVTVATFAGLTQAIKLAAIAEGVPAFAGNPAAPPPASGDKPADPNATVTVPGSDVIKAQQDGETAAASSRAARAAALAILTAIANESGTFPAPPAAQPDATTISAAANRIKATFDPYSTALAGGSAPAATPIVPATPPNQ